jgi:cephalosporin-C deacetylase-like acetyl esterase
VMISVVGFLKAWDSAALGRSGWSQGKILGALGLQVRKGLSMFG